MSRTAVIFLVLVLVIASCIIAGCSSLPFTSAGTPTPTEAPKKQNAGLGEKISPGTAQQFPGSVQRFPLDSAVADIFSEDSAAIWNDNPENITEENISPEAPFPRQVLHIRGTNLDENGDAGSWTFVVERGDRLSFVTYSSGGIKVTGSPGRISRTVINTDQIISPRELFEKNRALISGSGQQGAAVSRELILSEGIFTLTITNQGTPRVLTFDAKTGALKSTND